MAANSYGNDLEAHSAAIAEIDRLYGAGDADGYRLMRGCALSLLDELRARYSGPSLPAQIDRSKHGSVLMVWNDCMINHETLEMTWPKLVNAIIEAEKRTTATVEKE